jgi:di/tricarboxylate transporter/CRP-like cAMP-binding protein
MATTLNNDHAELLRNIELFRGLDRVTLAKLAAHLETRALGAGEVIFRQGDPPDGLYLISRGTVSVSAAGDAVEPEVTLSKLRRGDALGEIALLTGAVRSATARADEEGELLRLDQKRFRELIERDPTVALAISAGLIRRLRSADAARLGIPLPPEHTDALPAALPTPTARAPRSFGRRHLGLLLGVLALAIGWLVPPPSDLSVVGWHALLSLVALVPLLALGSLPDGATALLLTAVWVVGGIAPPRAALSGFATSTWILTVTIFGVGAAVASSGLLYRVALSLVARAGSFRRQVAALGVGGLLLGAAIPNATGRMSLVAAAVAELADAVGYGLGSRAAAGLAMAAFVGFGVMVAPFITSSTTALLALALLPDSSKTKLNFVSWAVSAAPLHIVLLLGLLGFIMWRYSPSQSDAQKGSAAVLRLQQTLLGRLTSQERVAGLVTLAMLIGFVTQPLHGVDPAWVSVSAFVILSGTGVLTLETLRSVNWNTVLLLGVLASMAEVASTTKLDVWMGTVIAGAIGNLGAAPVLFVGALTVVCMALSFVLRWQAAVPLLVLALAPVAGGAHIDPWIVAIVALTATNCFFMPYQSTIYLALYTSGGSKLFNHAQARPIALAYAALTFVGLLASVPIWHLMGLL